MSLVNAFVFRTSRKLKILETYIALSRSMYFYILNCSGMNHDCDGRTDRQTERPLAIAHVNIELNAR